MGSTNDRRKKEPASLWGIFTGEWQEREEKGTACP